jgi:hypothetical protein
MLKRVTVVIALLAATSVPAVAASHAGAVKLDAPLRARATSGNGTSRVIIETTDGSPLDGLIRSLKGKPGRRLGLLRGQVADIPNGALEALADRASVRAVRLDRRVTGAM